MAIESLDIGVRMCNRVVRMVEAGKSVEDLEQYFGQQKYRYKDLLRQGTGHSEADWDRDEAEFEAMLNPSDEPNIVGMSEGEPFTKPEPEPKDDAPIGINRMLTSTDLRS